MPSKLFELDSTNYTTGASNWMSRKRDAWLAGGGNGDAIGRHTTRLVANKLYQSWRAYLGSQGKQGTTTELAAFISRFYGADNVSALSQKFPQVFPPGAGPTPGTPPSGTPPGQGLLPGPPPGPPPGGGPPPPGGGPPPPGPPPGGPGTPSGTPQATADDKQSYDVYQRYLQRLRPILETPTPNPPAVLRLLNRMLRDFSKRSEKAKTWVRAFFRDKLSSYVQIVPALAKFTGKDPFSIVPQPRSRRAAPGATGPGAAPGGATPGAAGPAPTPQPTPPAKESRQRRGQLIEAPAAAPASDPSLSIPPAPNSPPDFLRRQTNGVVLNRALADQIFVELARMMIDKGEANVGPRQTGNGGDTGGGGGRNTDGGNSGGRSGGGTGGGRTMQARISWNAMQQGIRQAGQVSSQDMAAIQQVIQAAGNQAPTIGEIIAGLNKNNHGTLQTSTMLALLYASQYA